MAGYGIAWDMLYASMVYSTVQTLNILHCLLGVQ